MRVIISRRDGRGQHARVDPPTSFQRRDSNSSSGSGSTREKSARCPDSFPLQHKTPLWHLSTWLTIDLERERERKHHHPDGFSPLPVSHF